MAGAIDGPDDLLGHIFDPVTTGTAPEERTTCGQPLTVRLARRVAGGGGSSKRLAGWCASWNLPERAADWLAETDFHSVVCVLELKNLTVQERVANRALVDRDLEAPVSVCEAERETFELARKPRVEVEPAAIVA